MMRCLIGPVLCTPNTPTALRSRARTSFPPSLLVLVLSLPSKEELRPKNHLDYRLDRRHRAGNGTDATLQKLARPQKRLASERLIVAIIKL